MFALAGKVVNTGLVEVPMGTTLRQVVFDVGGGIPGGKRFKAVQIGGPSGGCLPESALDLPIDFDSLTRSRRDDGLRRHDRPRRGRLHGGDRPLLPGVHPAGVLRQVYLLPPGHQADAGNPGRIHQRQGAIEDLDTLAELAEEIKAGSLCGLGRTAPNPVLTTLRYFRDEYETHIKEGRCPALMCQDLIAYYIIPDQCEPCCDVCIKNCTVEAINRDKKNRVSIIDQEKCVKCGTCIPACPPEYNAIIKVSPPSEVSK